MDAKTQVRTSAAKFQHIYIFDFTSCSCVHYIWISSDEDLPGGVGCSLENFSPIVEPLILGGQTPYNSRDIPCSLESFFQNIPCSLKISDFVPLPPKPQQDSQ